MGFTFNIRLLFYLQPPYKFRSKSFCESRGMRLRKKCMADYRIRVEKHGNLHLIFVRPSTAIGMDVPDLCG